MCLSHTLPMIYSKNDIDPDTDFSMEISICSFRVLHNFDYEIKLAR